MKDTPAAQRYLRFELSSNLFGFTMEWAFGKLISDWWWSNTITSIFFFWANSIASKEEVPQSTVIIILEPSLINFSKPLMLGPYPSFCLSGMYVLTFWLISLKYFVRRAVDEAPSTS